VYRTRLLRRGPTTGRQTPLVQTTCLATPERHTRDLVAARAENNQAANQIGVAARTCPPAAGVRREKKSGRRRLRPMGKKARRGGRHRPIHRDPTRHTRPPRHGLRTMRRGLILILLIGAAITRQTLRQAKPPHRAAAVVPPPSPAGHFTARPTPAAHHRTASASLL
jgi:hypothetical protein